LWSYSGPDGPGSHYGSVYAREAEKDHISREEEIHVPSELNSSPIAFREQDIESTAHQLAYNGYRHFQNRWSAGYVFSLLEIRLLENKADVE
jgi:hypothetical protein